MTFRAVAREAVIFSLLGMALAGVGAIITAVLYAREAGKSAAREAVHGSLPPPIGYRVDNSIEVPLSDGTVLFVADCDQVHAKDDIFDEAARANARTSEPLPGTIESDCVIFEDNFFKKFGGQLSAVKLGDVNQVAIEKDYWQSYMQTRDMILKGDAVAVLLVSLAGFPAGFVIWGFYRVVRFAVEG